MDPIPNQDQEESDNHNNTDTELERLEGDNNLFMIRKCVDNLNLILQLWQPNSSMFH